eukprot:TRINITY_DN20217_c0_g1_i1.p1 TRINITY_DN20217_c0_g1~~TRINITY_DN20217_c0_g1_i1.p1  ORF type:complete len:495 (+),score=113.00 TRINITY_DN20217_c0_g1_i1:87-1571(+)
MLRSMALVSAVLTQGAVGAGDGALSRCAGAWDTTGVNTNGFRPDEGDAPCLRGQANGGTPCFAPFTWWQAARVLLEHNSIRRAHYSCPLTYDDELAEAVRVDTTFQELCLHQNLTAGAAALDSANYFGKVRGAGESRAMTWRLDAVLPARSWYCTEEDNVDYNALALDTADVDNTQFLQFLWARATRIGCAACLQGDFIGAICKYDVAPNAATLIDNVKDYAADGNPRAENMTTECPATPPPTGMPNTAIPATVIPGSPFGTTGGPNTALPKTLIPNTAAPSTGNPAVAYSTGVPNTAAPPTQIPNTVSPSAPMGSTAWPNTFAPLTAEPSTADPAMGPGATGEPNTASPFRVTEDAAAGDEGEDGEGGGAVWWVVLTLAVLGVCCVAAHRMCMRRKQRLPAGHVLALHDHDASYHEAQVQEATAAKPPPLSVVQQTQELSQRDPLGAQLMLPSVGAAPHGPTPLPHQRNVPRAAETAVSPNLLRNGREDPLSV